MNENVRRQLEAAVEDVKTTSEQEFRTQFEELYDRLDEFNRETDALLLQFGFDGNGIARWRLQHLDTTVDGSIFDKQMYVRHFEDDTNQHLLGANTLSIATSHDEVPEPADFRAALYAVLRHCARSEHPDEIIVNPSVQIRLKATDDGFKISYLHDS